MNKNTKIKRLQENQSKLLSQWLQVIHSLPPVSFPCCMLYYSPLPCPQPTHPVLKLYQTALIPRKNFHDSPPCLPFSPGDKHFLWCSFVEMLLIPQGLVKCPLLSSIPGQTCHSLICGSAVLCFCFCFLFYNNGDFYPRFYWQVLISSNLLSDSVSIDLVLNVCSWWLWHLCYAWYI